MDTFTSLLAGFTIFAVLGNLAYELGVPVDEVVRGGNGLAFISYPDAIAKFDWVPQLFAVLFFLMLFTLGIGSSMADAGAIVTIFCDKFPSVSRVKVTSAVCFVGCAVGIVYCTPGGQFILNLVDYFGGTFVIYTTSLLEVIGIAWIYGTYNFISDIEFMLNIRIGWYWKICWGFIIPVGLTVILIYSLATEGNVTYDGIPYPTVALVLGWMIFVVSIIAFPIGIGHAASQTKGVTMWDRFTGAFKPKDSWGPRNPIKKAEWQAYKDTLVENTFFHDAKRKWYRIRAIFSKS
jgi:solute carrier family 6 amino acid transporter-like protein 5/7/9/14